MKEFTQHNGICKCNFCNKEYSINGIYTHIWRNHGDGINHNPNIGYKTKNRKIWNKGLNKNSDKRVLKYAETLSRNTNEQINNGSYLKKGFSSPSFWTQEKRKEYSIRISQKNPGGKSKWFIVDNKNVQGKWERDFALKLNENNIKWERCKPFIYIKNNKEKRYTPDFYLNQYDKFIEIKGYWWGDDKEKMKLVLEQNPWLKNKIIVLEKNIFIKLMKNFKKEIYGLLADLVYACD